jgi:hypothetical protein
MHPPHRPQQQVRDGRMKRLPHHQRRHASNEADVARSQIIEEAPRASRHYDVVEDWSTRRPGRQPPDNPSPGWRNRAAAHRRTPRPRTLASMCPASSASRAAGGGNFCQRAGEAGTRSPGNRDAQKNSTTKVKGVCWYKPYSLDSSMTSRMPSVVVSRLRRNIRDDGSPAARLDGDGPPEPGRGDDQVLRGADQDHTRH